MREPALAQLADGATNGVQVIARAAAILRALKGEDAGLTLSQLAERLDLPRSTVQRIVGALQAENLVISATANRGIRLGPGLAALAEGSRIDIVEVFHPHLTALSRATRETVDLAVLRGKNLVFIDQVPGTHRLRTVSAVGETFPLPDTANGKAALALFTDEEVTELLSPGINGEEMTRLLNELAEVRKTGIAYDLDEHTIGICAVGGALIDTHGEIYAVSVPVPSARFSAARARLVEALHDALITLGELEPVAQTTASGASEPATTA